jgi:hypothetical protein
VGQFPAAALIYRKGLVATGDLLVDLNKITNIGHDPWPAKELDGVVKFKRPDASRLKVTALDFNGDPGKSIGTANEIRLAPSTIYNLHSAP